MIGIARGYTLVYLFWSTYRYYLDQRSGSMIVENHNDGSITVTVDIELKVGKRFRISPSIGYAGVCEGTVDILAIVPGKPDNEEIYGTVDTGEVIPIIESYREVMLDLHTDRNEVPYEPEYSTVLTWLDNTDWVVYKYPHNDDNTNGELYVFPVETFIEHVSMW